MPYALALEPSKDSELIAQIPSTDTPIFIDKIPYDGEPKIDTTDANKLLIFQSFLRQKQDLSNADVATLINAFNNKKSVLIDVKPKIARIYELGVDYVNDSLRRLMNLSEDFKVIPVLPARSVRIYCTGLSGSGKSWYLSELIKNNYSKDCAVYLFSPVKGDEAYKKLNIVQIHLESYDEDWKRPFAIEVLAGTPKNPSIVIMDDIQTFSSKALRNLYIDAQNQILERGRHLNIGLTLTVSHNPLAGALTKAPIRESEFYILFPSSNHRDTKALLKTYTGLSQHEIDEILQLRTRGVIVKKSVPSYYVADHGVGILGK